VNAVTPLTPEILVPRLGDYLVEKGVLSRSDLLSALKRQEELREQGKPILLGELLIQLGLIDRPTLDGAVTEQIIQLRAALQETNRQLERRVEERTAELQKALKKLSELNQLKSNIISNISHELRTPMTHMKGYLELLISGSLGELNPQQQNALEVMQRSSDRLERLIEDLIQFSMASRGEFTLRPSRLDVNILFNTAVARSRSKANDRNVTVEIKAPEMLPLVMADEEKITWVVMQLLDNAIKFTPPGGRVSLEASEEGEFVQVSVQDTGIGIPKERQEEIFEAFHQLDGSTTRRYGGTGLGLALVRQIVEAHGSMVRVSSEVNRGSRFEFLLPISKDVVPTNG
jgi:signal transduction histidine kinase